MSSAACKCRRWSWQVWRPKRGWYGGETCRPDGAGGIERKLYLVCGCGCGTRHPDYGKWASA